VSELGLDLINALLDRGPLGLRHIGSRKHVLVTLQHLSLPADEDRFPVRRTGKAFELELFSFGSNSFERHRKPAGGRPEALSNARHAYSPVTDGNIPADWIKIGNRVSAGLGLNIHARAVPASGPSNGFFGGGRR
jgi:hypothetical protein